MKKQEWDNIPPLLKNAKFGQIPEYNDFLEAQILT